MQKLEGVGVQLSEEEWAAVSAALEEFVDNAASIEFDDKGDYMYEDYLSDKGVWKTKALTADQAKKKWDDRADFVEKVASLIGIDAWAGTSIVRPRF